MLSGDAHVGSNRHQVLECAAELLHRFTVQDKHEKTATTKMVRDEPAQTDGMTKQWTRRSGNPRLSQGAVEEKRYKSTITALARTDLTSPSLPNFRTTSASLRNPGNTLLRTKPLTGTGLPEAQEGSTKEQSATFDQTSQAAETSLPPIASRRARKHSSGVDLQARYTCKRRDYRPSGSTATTKNTCRFWSVNHLSEQDGTLQCSAGPEWYGCHGTFGTLASTWAPAVGRPSESAGCLAARKKRKETCG